VGPQGLTPDVAVVVPSHDRPLRLRWLLNALEEQTLERERWELIVAHDSSDPETARLLATHPVAPRAIAFAPGPGPAQKRNAGWRAATAPLVAFTDDDCRPPAQWLERLVVAARAAPGAIVQGRTTPDPDELGLLHAAPWSRTQAIDPPTVWAQTCNIAYPRALLERLDGFDERLPVASGEDTDLAQRALESGATLVAAPEVETHHAVDAMWLVPALRSARRWGHLAYLVKRHPVLREALPARVFWKRSHALLLAGVAVAVASRRPAGAVALVPWALEARPRYGRGARGLVRAASELPGRAALDATEIAALARGSAHYRTFLL
jgi:glycosyltransferase involved in cell wall biosynthesis